jgi:hypothetical protein
VAEPGCQLLGRHALLRHVVHHRTHQKLVPAITGLPPQNPLRTTFGPVLPLAAKCAET